MARYWYSFVGGPTGDPRLASDYSKITGKPSCFTGTNICVIYVSGGDITPDTPFSINILQYLADAAGSTVPQPTFPSRAKKYLYKRN